MPDQSKYKTLIALTLSLIFIMGLGFFYFYQSNLVTRKVEQPKEDPVVTTNKDYSDFTEVVDIPPSIKNNLIKSREEYMESGTNFIEADLSKMEVTLYKEGALYKIYPIVSKGREGSWWETPAGRYEALSKEEKHFSSVGGVWMPWSVRFYGNYFIHGWPYHDDGSPVPLSYSGGCIRLNNEDAKEIYEFAQVDTPILISDSDYSENFGILTSEVVRSEPPKVSAHAYLIYDLSTEKPIIGKNAFDVVSIASLTKLMTGVVSSELAYLQRYISVEKNSTSTSTVAWKPMKGEKYIAFDLLYALLMQSSNDAAEMLLGYLGETRFINGMNNKAKSLYMDKTVFADASGKLAANQSTTFDIAKLLRYIYFKRKFLFDISLGKQDYRFDNRVLDNLANFNEFANDPDIVGMKNGKSTSAKETLAGVWELDGIGGKVPVAIIVLGSTDRAKDAKLLLDWLKENY